MWQNVIDLFVNSTLLSQIRYQSFHKTVDHFHTTRRMW